MNKLYCPRCGFANDPKNQFCKHCGLNLVPYKQRMHSASNPKLTQAQFNNRPQRSTPQYNGGYYNPRQLVSNKHHHYGLIISLLIIIILAVFVFLGVGAYYNNSWPFGNGPVSRLMGQNQNTSGQQTSSAYAPIKTFWNHINNKLDSSTSSGGSSSIDYLFQDNSDNNSLSGIHGWLDYVTSADENNDTEVTSITPYDFYSSNGEVHYKVKYDFKLHAHSSDAYHHIQIFDWHAKVQDGKIVSMASPKEPIKDYKE